MQSSPTNTLYAQALAFVNSLRSEYASSKSRDPNEISVLINQALSAFEQKIGSTITEYEPIVHSEIPSSERINKFMAGLQSDINILEDQIDVLKANAIFTHNFIKTEVMKAKRENSRLQNKLKTLELYSNTNDDSLVFFGDNFVTDDFVDWSLVPPTQRANIHNRGSVTLGIQTLEPAIDGNTKVVVLEGSNGFFGNNQEIDDPNLAVLEPISKQKLYTFKSELDRHADKAALLDNQPTTWFEFEKYLVSDELRNKAKNYNFEYAVTHSEDTMYLTPSTNSSDTQSTVVWANGAEGNVLRLIMETDLNTIKAVNLITLSPFGLDNNKNNPIKVVSVAVSADRNVWTTLSPENLWIVNSIDRKISFLNAENIAVGSAQWVTNGNAIRYIRFSIEQNKPIDCNVGHLYYVPTDSTAGNTPNYNTVLPSVDNSNATYNTSIPYNNPLEYGGSAVSVYPGTVGYDDYRVVVSDSILPTIDQSQPLPDDLLRQPGPVPTVDDPIEYNKKPAASVVSNMIQKKEYFKGKRWAIAIRDITADSIVYDTSSLIVTQKFNIPGIIDRVALEADIEVPDSFVGFDWIKFFISPNNGFSWYRISRIQDDNIGIPEIIAFNDPTPKELRESGVGYYDVREVPNSLRLRIEISRPDSEQYSSPIVKSYKLKVIKR